MGAGGALTDDLDYLTRLVREHDRPRYYSTLFAPASIRPDLLALYGFAAEIARIPDQVRESGLGEIRLRWWQDALLEGDPDGGGGATPALRAIGRVTEKHALPLGPLEALIDARAFDLYANAPPHMNDLEGRLGETESALFQLAAIVAGGDATATADASGHAGIAYGLAQRLGNFTSDRARGRSIIPENVLGETGLTAADVFQADTGTALQQAVSALVAAALQHHAESVRALGGITTAVRHVFLPLAIVPALLARVQRLGAEVAVRNTQLSDLSVLSRIAAARVFGFEQPRRS